MTFAAVSKIEISSSMLTSTNRRMPVKIHGTELQFFSCEVELFLLRETEFCVIFYLDKAVHEFDFTLVYKMHASETATNDKLQSCFFFRGSTCFFLQASPGDKGKPTTKPRTKLYS